MGQHQVIYGYGSLTITALLFAAIAAFNEVGFGVGRFIQNRTDTEIKTLTGLLFTCILEEIDKTDRAVGIASTTLQLVDLPEVRVRLGGSAPREKERRSPS